MDQQAWNERTRQRLEEFYLQARTAPGGSSCGVRRSHVEPDTEEDV